MAPDLLARLLAPRTVGVHGNHPYPRPPRHAATGIDVLDHLGIVRTLWREHRRHVPQALWDDLYAELVAEAVACARTYEPEPGLSFARWLGIHAPQVIQRVDPYPFPSGWRGVKSLARKRRSILTVELGRTPTIDELRADVLECLVDYRANRRSEGTREERRSAALTSLRRAGALAAIAALDQLLAYRRPGSLDRQLTDVEGSSTVGETVADNVDIEAGHLLVEERDQILELLDRVDLTDRERYVLRRRYESGRAATFAAIGAEIGISGEIVRRTFVAVRAKLALAMAS